MNDRMISKTTLIDIVILAGFTVLFLVRANFEFLIYTVTLSGLIYLLERTDRMMKYSCLAKWGFTVWLAAHLVGGSVNINGQRLYDTVLINIVGQPYYILRYDQAIHTFCYFVMTLFIGSVVLHISSEKASRAAIITVVALASLGVSAVNEIVELSAVVFFNSSGVGDYYNNALDMVFNLAGIMIAVACGKVGGEVAVSQS